MIFSQSAPSSIYDSEFNYLFCPLQTGTFFEVYDTSPKGNSQFFCVCHCNVFMQFKNTGKTPFRVTGNKTITVKAVDIAATFHYTKSKVNCFLPLISRQVFTKIAPYLNRLCKSRKDRLREKLKSKLYVLVYVDKSMKLDIFWLFDCKATRFINNNTFLCLLSNRRIPTQYPD